MGIYFEIGELERLFSPNLLNFPHTDANISLHSQKR